MYIKIAEAKRCLKTPSPMKTQTKGISIRFPLPATQPRDKCRRIHRPQITYSFNWKSRCRRLSVIRLKCILYIRRKKTNVGMVAFQFDSTRQDWAFIPYDFGARCSWWVDRAVCLSLVAAAAFFINLCVLCVLTNASFLGTQFLHSLNPQSTAL